MLPRTDDLIDKIERKVFLITFANDSLSCPINQTLRLTLSPPHHQKEMSRQVLDYLRTRLDQLKLMKNTALCNPDSHRIGSFESSILLDIDPFRRR